MDDHELFRSFRQMEMAYVYNPHRHSKEMEGHYLTWLCRLLEAAGADVERNGSNDRTDLVVNGHQVEVKISRPRQKARRREYYQFLLRDHGNQHYLNGEFVLCLCVTEKEELCPFVIPVEAVGARRTVEISSDPWEYAGQWASFRAAYDYFG